MLYRIIYLIIFTVVFSGCSTTAFQYLEKNYYSEGEDVPAWSPYLMEKRRQVLNLISNKVRKAGDFFIVDYLTNSGGNYTCVLYIEKEKFVIVDASDRLDELEFVNMKTPFQDYIYKYFQEGKFLEILDKSDKSSDIRGTVYVTHVKKNKEGKFSLEKHEVNIFLTEEQERQRKEMREFIERTNKEEN